MPLVVKFADTQKDKEQKKVTSQQQIQQQQHVNFLGIPTSMAQTSPLAQPQASPQYLNVMRHFSKHEKNVLNVHFLFLFVVATTIGWFTKSNEFTAPIGHFSECCSGSGSSFELRCFRRFGRIRCVDWC